MTSPGPAGVTGAGPPAAAGGNATSPTPNAPGMNVVSLCSGIGGLDLGLQRAGMTIIGQVERDPLCRSVLARHWPDVPRHDDVATFAAWWRQERRPDAHVIAGGIPCQPFSHAGFRRGVSDERWLWPAMADAIRVAGPRYVILENVSALLSDRAAFGWILSDLAAFGFDADWSVLSACAVGAPHTRERLLLVAYPHGSDGAPRLGNRDRRPRPVREPVAGPGSWRDRVDRAVEAAATDDRDTDGTARGLVAAGGNAVVPQVAEFIGRVILGNYSKLSDLRVCNSLQTV